MKTRKRTWKRIAFFDECETVRYLEKEARKGWVLENVFGIWWTFRRAEPRPAHVWISYLTQEFYDTQPDQKLEAMMDLGEHTGWKLMVTTPDIQVFYNWQQNPVPMETDPVARAEGMHRALKQRSLTIYRVYFVLTALAMLSYAWIFLEDPLWLLSHWAERMLVDILLFVAVGAELIPYELWYRKAKKMAAQGEWLDTRPWGRVDRWFMKAYVILLLLVTVVTLVVKPWAHARMFIVVTNLSFGVAWCFVLLVRDVLRRRKVSRSKNEVITAAVAFFGAIAIVSVMAAAFTHLNWFSPLAADSWWSQYPNGLPLTVEQLRGDVGNQEFWILRDGEESLVLGQYRGWQVSEEETEPDEDMDTVMYTVALVKVPLIYDLCVDEMLWETNEPVDATPWMAREAYRKTDSPRLRTYLLCYEGCVVEIQFGWEPTEEQMQLVGETFGGDML